MTRRVGASIAVALLAALITLVLGTWGAENTFGMWTFAILYFARISAKLNLYLGVPKRQLPRPLHRG